MKAEPANIGKDTVWVMLRDELDINKCCAKTIPMAQKILNRKKLRKELRAELMPIPYRLLNSHYL